MAGAFGGSTSWMGFSPWERPDIYHFESAMTHVPEVTAPFLKGCDGPVVDDRRCAVHREAASQDATAADDPAVAIESVKRESIKATGRAWRIDCIAPSRFSSAFER